MRVGPATTATRRAIPDDGLLGADGQAHFAQNSFVNGLAAGDLMSPVESGKGVVAVHDFLSFAGSKWRGKRLFKVFEALFDGAGDVELGVKLMTNGDQVIFGVVVTHGAQLQLV